MDNRCAHCNGTLVLSVDHTKWVCEYCDSEFMVNNQSNASPTCRGQCSSDAHCIDSVKVTKEAIQKINAYLASNQKLNAIKFVREISGLSLADAVAWIDNYKKDNL